ncbi:MAG TPA: hypothetical protein VKO18_20435 [Terriglobia bacterium]|nr:hypothetical protein [Terriglobia bacterium]
MPDKTKRLRDPVVLAAFAAMFAARLSFGGAGVPPGAKKLKEQPVSTLWRVTYMGGPTALRKGTDVDLRVSESTISFAAAEGRSGREFSIPVADVTDVSNAIIEGNRDEKVFGPDELDPNSFVTACGKVPDLGMEDACISGGIGLLIPLWVVKGVLVNMPYKDRFIRIAWQREAEDPAVVFQVSRRDYVRLRRELERVTEKSVGNRVRRPDSQEVVYEAAIRHVEEFDREVARIHVQRWLNDQCQSSSLDMPSWLRPSSSRKTLTLCPSAATEIDEARDQLLAK